MIERLRQRIRAMHSITAAIGPDDYKRAMEYFVGELGFVVMDDKLRWSKERGDHYQIIFMRELEVMADTDRGDSIADDGRYETK